MTEGAREVRIGSVCWVRLVIDTYSRSLLELQKRFLDDAVWNVWLPVVRWLKKFSAAQHATATANGSAPARNSLGIVSAVVRRCLSRWDL